MSKLDSFRKVWRFALTGLGATIIHVSVAAAVIEFLSFTPSLANGLAFIVATVFSYFVNTLWSFETNSTLRNAARFWVASCVGFTLAVSLSGFAESQGWHYMVGISLVVIAVPTVSFLVHNFWTYR